VDIPKIMRSITVSASMSCLRNDLQSAGSLKPFFVPRFQFLSKMMDAAESTYSRSTIQSPASAISGRSKWSCTAAEDYIRQ
jgi:hypothetical protein